WIEEALEKPTLRHWLYSRRLPWYHLCFIIDFSSTHVTRGLEPMIILDRKRTLSRSYLSDDCVLYYYRVTSPLLGDSHSLVVRQDWESAILATFELRSDSQP